MTWIAEHIDEIAAIAAGIYAVANLIARLTPTPRDDAFLASARKLFKDIFAKWRQ